MTPSLPPPSARKAFGIDTARQFFARLRQTFAPPSVPRVDDRALRRYLKYFNDETDRLSNALTGGKITVDQWEREFLTQVDHLHTTTYIIGRGGVSNLSQDDLKEINRLVTNQQVYVRRFADELRRNMRDEAYVRNRMKLYGGAANESVQVGTTVRMGIPTLPFYPGQETQCHTNCKCRWDPRKLSGNGDFDVYWRLAPAEHCETCLSRQRACNPLRIRGGVIQPFNETGTIWRG